MAFKRTESSQRSQLTSLIDIVFLLLIFFLVSFAFSLSGDVSESKVYAEIELPKTNTDLQVIKDDWLSNLMIQIVPDTSKSKSKRVYILWPLYEDDIRITRAQAFRQALQDSTFAYFPTESAYLHDGDFKQLSASRLITRSINKYVEYEKLYRGNQHPLIEVRADQKTEFKIISYIMKQCSEHKDAIPQIVIRMIP